MNKREYYSFLSFINKIETVLNKCNWVHFDTDNELFSDYLQGATQTRV
jgi:hypothetical protein